MVENISSPNALRTPNQKRNITSIVGAVVLALLLVLVVRLLLQPDPQGYLLWTRAQRLESSNLIRPALRQYDLLAQTNPNSPYAPLALERSGDILTDLARAGDASRFRQAMTAYNRLVTQYPRTPQAANALLAMGDLALNDLKDFKTAQTVYTRILANTENIEYSKFAPQAMIGLGRVAIAARDGKGAQKWFQRVLKEFPNQRERSGEAQFRLGETYETLWRNKEFARNAYGATLANYGGTIWAARAKENLGLLVYSDMVPRARRVLVRAANLTGSGALANEPDSANSLLGGLRLVLRARGLDATDVMIRGWSLSPFVAAFDPQNPARAVPLALDGFENAVDAAGLSYAIDDGGDSKSALQNLQNEIDTGHLMLVFTGRWQLVVGYDSSREQVFLSSGTRAQTVQLKDFIASWNRKSALGGAFSSVSFSTPADDVREERLRAPQSVTRLLIAPTPDANNQAARELNLPNPELLKKKPMIAGTGVAFSPAGLSAPTWILTPPSLDEKTVHRKTLRRASEWMRRERSDDSLLNLGALRSLESEMRRLAKDVARERTSGQNPDIEYSNNANNNGNANNQNASTPTPLATPLADQPARQVPLSTTPSDGTVPDSTSPDSSSTNDSTDADDNMGLVLPEATPSPQLDANASTSATPKPTRARKSSTRIDNARAPLAATSSDTTQRLRAILGWRGAPAAAWMNARRDAATYLNIASQRLNDAALREAATAFENSVVALENARAILGETAATSSQVDGQRRASIFSSQLERAANAIANARREETRATQIMAAQR